MDKRFALTDDQLEAVAGGLLDEAAEVVKSEPDPMERRKMIRSRWVRLWLNNDD